MSSPARTLTAPAASRSRSNPGNRQQSASRPPASSPCGWRACGVPGRGAGRSGRTSRSMTTTRSKRSANTPAAARPPIPAPMTTACLPIFPDILASRGAACANTATESAGRGWPRGHRADDWPMKRRSSRRQAARLGLEVVVRRDSLGTAWPAIRLHPIVAQPKLGAEPREARVAHHFTVEGDVEYGGKRCCRVERRGQFRVENVVERRLLDQIEGFVRLPQSIHPNQPVERHGSGAKEVFSGPIQDYLYGNWIWMPQITRKPDHQLDLIRVNAHFTGDLDVRFKPRPVSAEDCGVYSVPDDVFAIGPKDAKLIPQRAAFLMSALRADSDRVAGCDLEIHRIQVVRLPHVAQSLMSSADLGGKDAREIKNSRIVGRVRQGVLLKTLTHQVVTNGLQLTQRLVGFSQVGFEPDGRLRRLHDLGAHERERLSKRPKLEYPRPHRGQT